jgi:hypothetical protein
MDRIGRLSVIGALSVLMMPLGFLTAAGAGVSDEQLYDYDGHNYDSYQVDFLDGDYIDIKYTMDSNKVIDVYFMNRSNFQAYRTNHGVGGWPGVAYIYNLSDLETNHTKISGSLTAKDSYFFIFEYRYGETHIDFGINYEIKGKTAATNTIANTNQTGTRKSTTHTSQYEAIIYTSIIGSVIGSALTGAYIMSQWSSIRFGMRAIFNTLTNYQTPEEIITVDPLSNEGPSVMSSVHEKVNISNNSTTIVMKDCVINRSFTDMGAPKSADKCEENRRD